MERIKKYESLLGKWKVKRKLGEDDLSAVYEVESEQFGYISKNAVKLITFKNEEISEGMKEAVILTKLQGREHILSLIHIWLPSLDICSTLSNSSKKQRISEVPYL